MPTPRQSLSAGRLYRPAVPPRPAPVVDYPDWGVEPMTPVHWKAMVDATLSLREHYAHRDDVYVGSDMTMYWREGDNERAVMPDVFVAFGPSRDREREVWKVWEEGKLADFVLEVASKGTHRRDQVEKRALYESLGVAEYWQHDPTGKYLPPVLLGHRLNATGTYEPVPLATKPDRTRYGRSNVLDLHLCLDEDHLRLFDPSTGEFLATNNDKNDMIEDKRRIIEDNARVIAEERRAREAAEAEVEELKRRLAHR